MCGQEKLLRIYIVHEDDEYYAVRCFINPCGREFLRDYSCFHFPNSIFTFTQKEDEEQSDFLEWVKREARQYEWSPVKYLDTFQIAHW